MELGLDFDDNDFAKEIKQKQTLTSYNAKVCYPEWFLSDKADNSKNDRATLYKFRGDYLYQKKDVKSAIDCYNISLDSLDSHNRSMRREVMESLARCHIRAGDFQMAGQYTEQVLNDCLTIDNYCQALMLQQQLHTCSGDLSGEVSVLHQLVTLHSVNAQFWLKLSDVYEKIRDYLQTTSTQILPEACDKDCNSQSTLHKHIGLGSSVTETKNEINHEQSELNSKARNPKEEKCSSEKCIDHSKEACSNTCSNTKQAEEDTNCVNCTNCDAADENVTHALERVHIGNVNVKEEEITRTSIDNSHGCSSSRENVHCESGDGSMSVKLDYSEQILTGYPIDFILLTCYVRTRLILLGVQGTVGTFIKDRNIQLVEMMGSKIEDLSKDDSVLEVVTQFVRRDMFEENADDADSKQEQNQDMKVLMERRITPEEFNNRWFSWIKDIS